MTKEITKAIILQQIQEKFGLRELESEIFRFSEMVIPIYDIGMHVKNWDLQRYREEITGNGSLHFITVPDNERWKMRRIIVVAEAGGTYNIAIIYIYHPSHSTDNNYIFYNTVAPIAAGTVTIFEFPQDIPVEEGDNIDINISGFSVGGYTSIHILREVETIR